LNDYTRITITFVIMQKVNEIIRKVRKEKKLSANDVAEKVGLTQSGYFAIENGRSDISITRLYQIAEALETPVAELLGLDSSGGDALELERLKKRVEELEEKVRLQEREINDSRKLEDYVSKNYLSCILQLLKLDGTHDDIYNSFVHKIRSLKFTGYGLYLSEEDIEKLDELALGSPEEQKLSYDLQIDHAARFWIDLLHKTQTSVIKNRLIKYGINGNPSAIAMALLVQSLEQFFKLLNSDVNAKDFIKEMVPPELQKDVSDAMVKDMFIAMKQYALNEKIDSLEHN